jgi:SSS family solute:Na+ symporter
MAILFALNIIIMLVIGKVKPRTEDYIQIYTEQVEITPWPHAKKVGILIITIVVLTFYYFS